MLSSIGKGGGLDTKRRRKAPTTPQFSADEQLEILRLFPDGIGNRDHLPYTARFDAMYARFKSITGRNLDKHEFWRGVSRVAKLSRKPRPLYETVPLGGLNPELVAFLERNNPWWRGEPARTAESFRRWAFHEVVARMRADLAKIVVLRGSRRVGKSVIQNQLIEELLMLGRIDSTGKPVSPSRILYVQFDEAPGLGALASPIEAIVRWYEENILKASLNAAARKDEPAYLLFDEVQNLPNWSAQLKILADHSDARIIVTGSSAMRIAAGQDSLAGRMTVVEMGPLRLTEVAGIRGLGDLPAYATDVPLEEWKERGFWLGLLDHGRQHAKLRDKAFKLFSKFGGYPRCHKNPRATIDVLREQLILQVITKTIEHDPGHKPRTTSLDSTFLREVFRIACRYAGQTPTFKPFSEEIQAILETSVSQSRVNQALEFLSDSLLIYRVPPLELLAKKQAHSKKLCLCDHFVRNGMLQESLPIDPDELADCNQSVSTQAGHLVESILGYYFKGIPGIEISWFPTRSHEPEIDYVITIGTNRIPIEIKYRRGKPKLSDAAGIEAFCGKPAYSANFGLMVTQDEEGPIGKNALAIPLATFLMLR